MSPRILIGVIVETCLPTHLATISGRLAAKWKNGGGSKSESDTSGPDSWLWPCDCSRCRISDKLLGLSFSSGKQE